MTFRPAMPLPPLPPLVPLAELPDGYAAVSDSPHLFGVYGEYHDYYVAGVRETGRVVRYYPLDAIDDFYLMPASGRHRAFYPESAARGAYHAWLSRDGSFGVRLPASFPSLEAAIRAVTAITQCSTSMRDNPVITWSRHGHSAA